MKSLQISKPKNIESLQISKQKKTIKNPNPAHPNSNSPTSLLPISFNSIRFHAIPFLLTTFLLHHHHQHAFMHNNNNFAFWTLYLHFPTRWHRKCHFSPPHDVIFHPNFVTRQKFCGNLRLKWLKPPTLCAIWSA